MRGERIVDLDYIIVGAGPAGLQMAYFLEQAGRSYLILEASDRVGSFFCKYPRHRDLLSINKRENRYSEPEYNLRHDWNSLLCDDEEMRFTRYSDKLFPTADELTRYLEDYARQFKLRVRLSTRIKKIRKDAGGFELEDQSGATFGCRRLLMATGAVREHVPSDIEGIEHVSTYGDHTLNLEFYRNKRVAIIGGGNSAFEVANHLAGAASVVHLLVREPVRHAWQTHFPGDLRAINNTILDMYQLKSLHATLGFQPKRITLTPKGTYRLAMEEECPHWSTPSTIRLDLEYDHVISCTGWHYVDPSLYATDIVPETDKDGRYPVLSAAWESTVPGLYFMGTAMAARDKRAASSFIHGFRYNVRTLFHMLEEKYYDVVSGESASTATSDDLLRLAGQVVDRLSTSSGLYQLNGFLADAMLERPDGIQYIPELPISLISSAEAFRNEPRVITVSLEYGFDKYPSSTQGINFIHPSDVFQPDCSAFLHPVLRLWERGELTAERHLGESLMIRYDKFFTEDSFCEGYDAIYRRMNEHKIANFVNEHFQLSYAALDESNLPDDVLERTVEPWSEERIQAYRQKQQEQRMRDEKKFCSFSA